MFFLSFTTISPATLTVTESKQAQGRFSTSAGLQMYNDDTHINQLTVGELRDLIRTEIIGLTDNRGGTVHGLRGIADLFGVSYTQAKRIKASGVIDAAVSQSGRTIVVDGPLALELWRKATHGRRPFSKL